MRTLSAVLLLGIALLPTAGFGAAPANAPAGTTGLCNDGTFYSGPTKKGACRGHKGVKDWYAEATAAPAPAATPAAKVTPAPAPAATPAAKVTPAPAPAPAAAPAPAEKSAATPAAKTAAPPAPAATAAPGGGAGKVWVNKSTKVYHCPGDRWYGKTKDGEYLSQADATAQGFKPDHGKACK
jgi:hypothetical protein